MPDPGYYLNPSAPNDWNTLESIFGAPNPLTSQFQTQAGDIGRNLGAFGRGGIHGLLQEQGVPMPDWMNRAAAILQNPELNMALGMTGGNVPKTLGLGTAAKTATTSTETWLKRLETALGDDAAFQPLMAELRANQGIGQAEAVDLASKFYGYTPPGTPRTKALKRIQERHDKLMKFKSTPWLASKPSF